MSEGKRDFIDALASQLYVALVSRPNPHQYPSDADEAGARRAAKQAFFLAEEFWAHKAERDPVNRRLSLDARTIETALKEPVSPPPFDRDKAFDDEFRGHSMCAGVAREAIKLYLVAIKDAAVCFAATHKPLEELLSWDVSAQIEHRFHGMLIALETSSPMWAMHPMKRVTTDIQHAMETMRLIERERR